MSDNSNPPSSESNSNNGNAGDRNSLSISQAESSSLKNNAPHSTTTNNSTQGTAGTAYDTAEELSVEKSINTLKAMGFSEELSESALILADGIVERAAELLLTLPADEIRRQVERDYETDSDDSDTEESYKMQILVRTDLGMGKGKIAAQVAHGALGVYRLVQSSSNETWKRHLSEWERIAEAKVVLKVTSEQMLMEFYEKAQNLGVPAVYIEDAGRTQIDPGSKTVLALGPCPEAAFSFTKDLKLL